MVPIHHPDLMGPAAVAEEIPKVNCHSNTLLVAVVAPRLLHPVPMGLVVAVAVVAARAVGASTQTTQMATTLLSHLLSLSCVLLPRSGHSGADRAVLAATGQAAAVAEAVVIGVRTLGTHGRTRTRTSTKGAATTSPVETLTSPNSPL